MANSRSAYRSTVSGDVGVYDDRLARRHKHLVKVDDDAKPLAYVPATPEQVAEAIASTAPASEEVVDDEPAHEESED